MYDIKSDFETWEMADKAEKVLCCPVLFFNNCHMVFLKWPISVSVNLSNKKCNRRAWIGQAACCIAFGCNEISVRIAWGRMSLAQKNAANKIADKFINSFEVNERKDFKIYSGMGGGMLF